jgi:hypothetical protein
MLESFDFNKHSDLYPASQYGRDMLADMTIEKGVDYGYGITAHKSQGMTIDTAYVDIHNIKDAGVENPIFGANNVQVNTQKNALYYVAMSRASKKAVVDQTGFTFDKVIQGRGQSTDPNARKTIVTDEIKADYPVLSDFYDSLSSEDRKKIGTLGEIIDSFEEDPAIDSENEFVEKLKCNL